MDIICNISGSFRHGLLERPYFMDGEWGRVMDLINLVVQSKFVVSRMHSINNSGHRSYSPAKFLIQIRLFQPLSETNLDRVLTFEFATKIPQPIISLSLAMPEQPCKVFANSFSR